MERRDPNQSFCCLVNDTARLLRRDFNRRAQELGLTQTQWQALAHLKHNEGINQAALADLLEVQPITLGRLIDRLEANGWVERRPHPSDRRSLCLFLTPKAQPILEKMSRLAVETQEAALKGVPAVEREGVMDALTRIKGNLLSMTKQEEGTRASVSDPVPTSRSG